MKTLQQFSSSSTSAPPPINPWPSFNVADSCVVCAAILLALSTFFEKPEEKKADATASFRAF
jgi:lipoprotein signal peptidase